MRLLVLAVAFGALAAVAVAETPEAYIADSPGEIRPLLIGADIPDVTLTTPDYQPVALRSILSQQPTILIYYRGGW